MCETKEVSPDSINVDNRRAHAYLKGCEVKEVLGSDSGRKAIFLLLEKENEGQAVLIMDKTAFSETQGDITRLVHNLELTDNSKNDIFANYSGTVPTDLNILRTQLIHPATPTLIAKYRVEEKYIIEETPDDHEKITKVYIEKFQNSLQWVYNILEKKAEVDKMVFEDPDPQNGFVLSQDIKWDGKRIENLYLLAIVNRHGIKTIRDLTGDDVPMLKGIKEKCLEVINQKFGLRKDQVKAYFHYQPSFYHLHVHFINLKYDAPASTTLSAILLDDVINNLTIVPDFYQKATLSFTRKKSDKLLNLFREAGRMTL
ncbi:unnamed protein product [Auanema sp. JU1783]|nr:unnamed protein product [Auanema sp. JU1783]